MTPKGFHLCVFGVRFHIAALSKIVVGVQVWGLTVQSARGSATMLPRPGFPWEYRRVYCAFTPADQTLALRSGVSTQASTSILFNSLSNAVQVA